MNILNKAGRGEAGNLDTEFIPIDNDSLFPGIVNEMTSCSFSPKTSMIILVIE